MHQRKLVNHVLGLKSWMRFKSRLISLWDNRSLCSHLFKRSLKNSSLLMTSLSNKGASHVGFLSTFFKWIPECIILSKYSSSFGYHRFLIVRLLFLWSTEWLPLTKLQKKCMNKLPKFVFFWPYLHKIVCINLHISDFLS